MRLAIFGGTFDPIHSAHLTIAREARQQFRLDRILFVPAGNPPHKTESTSATFEHRFRMVELACRGSDGFVASRLEEGDRPSYSLLTVEAVRRDLAAGDELFFLIGADAFAEITTWFRWPELVRRTAFLVVTRPGHEYSTPPGGIVERLEIAALPVSSSEIRDRLRRGERPEAMPEQVLDYIESHSLYR